MQEEKPDSAPQNTPAGTLALPTSLATRVGPIQLYSTKAIVAAPVNTRTAASEICAASSQPRPTPTMAPGITIARIRPL